MRPVTSLPRCSAATESVPHVACRAACPRTHQVICIRRCKCRTRLPGERSTGEPFQRHAHTHIHVFVRLYVCGSKHVPETLCPAPSETTSVLPLPLLSSGNCVTRASRCHVCQLKTHHAPKTPGDNKKHNLRGDARTMLCLVLGAKGSLQVFVSKVLLFLYTRNTLKYWFEK